MNKVLVVDYEKCTGCRSCEMACSLFHVQECNPVKSAVQIVKWEVEGLDVPVICQQCEEPACANICPVRAISRDAATGAMVVDYDLCMGCRDSDPWCVRFCETGALTYRLPPAASMDKKRVAGRRLVEAVERSTGLL